MGMVAFHLHTSWTRAAIVAALALGACKGKVDATGKVVAEGPIAGNPTTMTLEEPLTASSFVIWITELPQNASGGNQIILNEITLN